LFACAGIASSLLVDALWDDAAMATFVAVGLIVVAYAHFRPPRHTSSKNAALTALRLSLKGVLLGVLLLADSMASWFFAEVLTGGRTGELVCWILRLGLSLLVAAIVYWLFMKGHRPSERARRTVGWALGIGVVGGLVGFLGYYGPADRSIYPPAQESPYRLPWKPGISRLCIQGNRTPISHWKAHEFAYDFVMPVGTEICAARAGRVVDVVDGNDGNGPSAPGNHVALLHTDGTYGIYAHIRQGGALVKVGQSVEQGDVIAESGNVGVSLLPHVHFHVLHRAQTIPITFADVPGDGLPRMFRRYRSGS
jgi:hypothetical protein